MYLDRDISWLAFNQRILQEAQNIDLPLYERVKFMAIYSANLDEFFRVRVAALQGLVKLNKKYKEGKTAQDPSELLKHLLQTVGKQLNDFGQNYRESILPALKAENIIIYELGQALKPEHQNVVRNFFRNRVLAYLQPVILSADRPAPFLKNRALYFFVQLHRSQSPQKPYYALVNIPSDKLPRFLALPTLDEQHFYIFLDDVLRHNLDKVFSGYEVEACYAIKLNRDADLHIDDEFSGDLIEKIQAQVKKRNLGLAARFLYDYRLPEKLKKYLQKTFTLSDEEMVVGGTYHNFNDFMQLPNPHKPRLEYPKREAVLHKSLEEQNSLFDAIRQQDYLLHFPYQSYDYVLRFFNEAAIDPFVREIKVTVYRIAKESMIANALISAARNGKKVSVFVEVKARFDEENNLYWAKAMQAEGIKISYSMPGLKVHAKVALFIRKKDGKREEFGFLGTGNFHEGTASIYADHGLLTANRKLSNELNQVFKFLNKRKPPSSLEHLLVSQFNLVPQLIACIEQEMTHQAEEKDGHIIIKVNNIEDPVLIDKLYEASQAGVKIDLLVRGICRVKAGIKGLSEHIRISRIVDRYLEHARVFIFNNRGEKRIYLGSADLMKRNLYHRIEVLFPLYQPDLREEILQIIDFQLNDCQSATWIDAKGNNIEKSGTGEAAQSATYQYLQAKYETEG